MMIYLTLDPRFAIEQLGYLPGFLNEDDPRPAAEQYDANYVGGWRPLDGWAFDPREMLLKYPGDPPLEPFAATRLRDEMILFFPYAQVMVWQPDGSFEVARMD